jgi:hypothetical protein
MLVFIVWVTVTGAVKRINDTTIEGQFSATRAATAEAAHTLAFTSLTSAATRAITLALSFSTFASSRARASRSKGEELDVIVRRALPFVFFFNVFADKLGT